MLKILGGGGLLLNILGLCTLGPNLGSPMHSYFSWSYPMKKTQISEQKFYRILGPILGACIKKCFGKVRGPISRRHFFYKINKMI